VTGCLFGVGLCVSGKGGEKRTNVTYANTGRGNIVLCCVGFFSASLL